MQPDGILHHIFYRVLSVRPQNEQYIEYMYVY